MPAATTIESTFDRISSAFFKHLGFSLAAVGGLHLSAPATNTVRPSLREHLAAAMTPRSRILQFLALFLAVVTFGLIWNHQDAHDPPTQRPLPTPLDREKPVHKPEAIIQAKPWDSSSVLKGPPTKQFRDNLKEDVYYITTWTTAGFTNQFMSYVNMIYLGILSNRVPILPPFVPSHHISRTNVTAITFGEVFNLTILRENLRLPILEWVEVKSLRKPVSTQFQPGNILEKVGCWCARPEGKGPVWSQDIPTNLALDPSYHQIAKGAFHAPPVDDWIYLNELAQFIWPKTPRDGGGPKKLMAASRAFKHELMPDEQLACFDMLYFATVSSRLSEWQDPWSPMWRLVGRHIRFSDKVMTLTKRYLTKAFNVEEENVPPFIAVHLRHGDFGRNCKPDSASSCFTPLSTFETRVKTVQEEIQKKHGKTVTAVLISSDETDPAFWTEVDVRGWAHIDHQAEQTDSKHGNWYSTLIDAAAHSLASGFIGTPGSTYSLLSARRVEYWNDGVFAWAS